MERVNSYNPVARTGHTFLNSSLNMQQASCYSIQISYTDTIYRDRLRNFQTAQRSNKAGKARKREKNSNATWFGKWCCTCCTQRRTEGMETQIKDVEKLLYSRRLLMMMMMTVHHSVPGHNKCHDCVHTSSSTCSPGFALYAICRPVTFFTKWISNADINDARWNSSYFAQVLTFNQRT